MSKDKRLLLDGLESAENKWDWCIEQSIKFGFHKELLQLLGIFMAKNMSDENRTIAFVEFKNVFSKLDAIKKWFLVMSFNNCMLQVVNYSPVGRKDIENIIRELDDGTLGFPYTINEILMEKSV
jgi:hypothetical protein